MFESKWMNDFHNFVGLWVRGIFRDNHDILTGNWLKSYHFAEVAWSGMVAMNNYLHPMIKGPYFYIWIFQVKFNTTQTVSSGIVYSPCTREYQ